MSSLAYSTAQEPATAIAASPARILFVDHTASLGGGELAMLEMIRHLDRKNFDPHVVLFSDGPLAQKLRDVHVPVKILPLSRAVTTASKDGLGPSSLLRLRSVWHTLQHVWRLRRFIRRGKFKIVHTNSLKADIIGGLAARLAFVPVVWHIRDRISDDYLPPKIVKLFRWLCRVIPTYLVANSRATLSTVTRGSRESVISSGVDLDQFPPSELQLNTTSPRIGLIGRISPWKGQEIFIRAAAQVCKKYPQAKFMIIGAALFDEKTYEQKLHALVDELGLSQQIEFTGFRNDIPQLLSQLDIVVHASTIGEPFGQVIVQAMAASKPVVATNGGGVSEIVVDSITGLLIPMSDAPSMAKAIEKILENPTQAAEMGRQGRRRVEDHFSITQTTQEVAKIYRELLAGSPPR